MKASRQCASVISLGMLHVPAGTSSQNGPACKRRPPILSLRMCVLSVISHDSIQSPISLSLTSGLQWKLGTKFMAASVRRALTLSGQSLAYSDMRGKCSILIGHILEG